MNEFLWLCASSGLLFVYGTIAGYAALRLRLGSTTASLLYSLALPIIYYCQKNVENFLWVILFSFIGLFWGQQLGTSFNAIGLTGNIACGKSSVARFLRDKRIPIIDADAIAREVVMPGCMAYKRIVRHFGKNVLNADGTINRQKLGDIVFKDKKQLKALNNCTHMFIILEMLRQLLRYRFIQRKRMVVIDAALLFETNVLSLFCFPIIAVACQESVQLQRIIARDGLSEEAALQRIKAQMPLEEKVRRANIVIDNSGSLKQLSERTLHAIEAASALLDNKSTVTSIKSKRASV